jgi:hypothetical protein
VSPPSFPIYLYGRLYAKAYLDKNVEAKAFNITYHWVVTSVAQRVPLMEQELLTLPEHMGSTRFE